MASAIIKKDIQLPPCDFNRGKFAIVLENVMTPEECQEYIDITEKRGYEAALINAGVRSVLDKSIRNNMRCMWDSEEEAARIWDRVKSFIPAEVQGRKVLGLNERLRFLRYDPGEYFKPHLDGNYVRENGEESFITLHLCLNEGFRGGCTTFFDSARMKKEAVVPKTGAALIFDHCLLHEGSVLEEGRKYAMRTDVMYAPPGE